MRCQFCSHEDTQVKDSRPSEDGMTIRRRRFCGTCNSRFTTFERVQLRELTVVKRDGDRKPFDRDKIVRAIAIAVRKRPVNQDQVEHLASQIVHRLETSGDNEIPSTAIGEMIMEGLKTLDKVAYIRFASVYRNFAEMKDFQEILGQLSTGKEAKAK